MLTHPTATWGDTDIMSYNFTEEQVNLKQDPSSWNIRLSIYFHQITCQNQREWPKFVYVFLATFGFCILLAILRWMISGKIQTEDFKYAHLSIFYHIRLLQMLQQRLWWERSRALNPSRYKHTITNNIPCNECKWFHLIVNEAWVWSNLAY